MLMVTTPGVEGRKVQRYIGLVSGEAIVGTNIFRDFFAGIRDITGGRSAAYEKELRKAKDIALEDLAGQARALGANAILSVDLDYAALDAGNGNMLMVSANGTAVVLE